jgi:hypothetical protein
MQTTSPVDTSRHSNAPLEPVAAGVADMAGLSAAVPIAIDPKRALCSPNLILEAPWIGYPARCIAEGERMSSTVFQIASIVAGLALFATQIFVVPRNGIKGLVKGLAVTVSLGIFAACLMTAIRSFGS